LEYQILEKEFSNYIGTKGCVAVNTGTSALHLALEALRLPEGSEVLVPQYTMVATAWAVYYARLRPVFVDCKDDLLIDLEELESKITKKTRVIMVTHVYGRVVNMTRIMEIANRYGLRVIEDAAEAHGCEWSGKKVGSFDIGCFSFYRNKIISGEEGGAVLSNDEELIKIAKDMKSMSFGEEHNYMHKQIGFNYRMTNSQASMILQSLRNVEQNINARRRNAEFYDQIIDRRYRMQPRDVPWVYDIKVPNNSIVDALRQIGARYGFKPVSASAPFKLAADSSNANRLSKHIMYLPCGPGLTRADIKRNVNVLMELL